MWRILLLTLALANLSLSVPAPQEGNGSLDDLINDALQQGSQTQSTVASKTNESNIDDLISSIFNTSQPVTTPLTTLGTQNKPKPEQEDCECVPYYQCLNGTISKDGYGIIDIRFGFDDDGIDTQRSSGGSFGPCDNYLDVCCKPPDKVQPGEKVTPVPVVRKGCGQRHPQGVGFRITGDKNNEAQFGEFPWMVAIIKDEIIGDKGKMTVYQCGGSLIHKQAVLTAAHCIQGKIPSELRIRAGEWDTQTNNEIYPHQDRNVQNVVIHEKYYSGALYNDFAILILSEPVEFADNVDIVCLPERGAVFDGSQCVASGWGKELFGKEGHYQVILKKVDLPLVPRDTCQNSLRNTRLGKYFTLHESFICAGGEAGKDTCKGDGGSPLVCPSPNNPSTYLQAGIVAWGIGCGGDGTPGVYANVAYARDWIDEQLAFYNLDNTVYQYNPKK